MSSREPSGTIGVAVEVLKIAFRATPRLAMIVIAMTAVVAICGAIQPLWFNLLVNAILERDEMAVLFIAGLIGMTTTTFVVLGWARFHASQSLQERTNLYLDEQMARMSLELPGIEHHERPAYQDKMTLLREQRIFLSQALMSTLGGVSIAIRGLAVAALLVSVHPALILLLTFGMGLIFCTQQADRLRDASLEATADLTRQDTHLFELATSARTAKELHIFGLDNELLARHARLWQAVDATRLKAMLQGAGIQALGWLGFVIGYVGAIAFVAWLVTQGRSTPGDMIMALGLATQSYGLLQGGLAIFAWMLLSLGAVRHYLWLRAYADADVKAEADAPHPRVPTRLRHGIDFEHVSFRYPGTDQDVLTDVTFQIPAGSTVAIVGDNGAGKSTLVKLLSRFYDPTTGRILVDDVKLQDFDIEEWRSRLASAFQDFARFEFVVQEAVGVGDLQRINNFMAVDRALEDAGAGELFATLPQGAETQLGRGWEGGVELSGGQWQKIALGRAMMREHSLVLMLDEPTASLDPQAEHELFQRHVYAARRASDENGAITVLVSHRFSTVRMADMIIVIEGGRVREVGSHEELQAAKGLYAELYELQARAYR